MGTEKTSDGMERWGDNTRGNRKKLLGAGEAPMCFQEGSTLRDTVDLLKEGVATSGAIGRSSEILGLAVIALQRGQSVHLCGAAQCL